MKKLIFTLLLALSFLVSGLMGQGITQTVEDFTVDFSASTGFGVSADQVQINNIAVTLRVWNPLTGDVSYITNTYNVLWRWDQQNLVLIPISAAEQGDEDACRASLEVRVTNALTGEPISGATVTVSGQSGTTDGEGRVTFGGLPEGNVQIIVSAPGFRAQSATAALACGEEVSTGISLFPEGDQGVARGDIRIVLTWGEEPRDLDAHLTGPRADASRERFHVFYRNRNNCNTSPCDAIVPAWLDVDDVTSFGPETITITKVGDHFVPGRYRYSVHHFAGALNIPQSGATVKIFFGDRLVKTYTPPAPPPGQEVGRRWVWTVCDIMIDEAGHISVIDVNTYTGPASSSDANYFSRARSYLGLPVGPEDIQLFRNLPEKN